MFPVFVFTIPAAGCSFFCKIKPLESYARLLSFRMGNSLPESYFLFIRALISGIMQKIKKARQRSCQAR
jgi:hypothetical protein